MRSGRFARTVKQKQRSAFCKIASRIGRTYIVHSAVATQGPISSIANLTRTLFRFLRISLLEERHCGGIGSASGPTRCLHLALMPTSSGAVVRPQHQLLEMLVALQAVMTAAR